jgi:hypothetical protein
MYSLLLLVLTALVLPLVAHAQENYEIQVYGSETMKPGRTMVELHSNFTIQGSKTTQDGMLPTTHAWHETIEITHGFNNWFETGVYFFNAASNSYGWQYVGSHIRPRVRVPEEWKWIVGVSLSTEVGYQRRQFSPDTWTLELRPIIDKEIGKWYLSFNPTVDRSFHGPSVSSGVVFSPNFKFSYDLTRKIKGGLEYYGSLGPVTGFDPLRDQQQQIIPAIDLDVSEDWEFNFGVGVGVTRGTDHLIVKCIVGRRFSIGRRHEKIRE